MLRTRRPTPPGTILLEHYLKPQERSIASFAREVGVSRKHMSDLVHGKVRLEPSLAYRVAAVLETSGQFWLNLQNAVDLHDVAIELENWRPGESLRA